ncbi:MAG: methyltransferase domain-containing protein [Caldilineaceae bacterium]|nr:methyltransferase domain-containing protein [Caldilineaceae bacterium]
MTESNGRERTVPAGAGDAQAAGVRANDTTAFAEFRDEVERVWNENSAYWDEYMGEGNDFVNVLCWPVTERFLAVEPEQNVLDIACGNGLTSRRLGRLGARVVAFDLAEGMIARAKRRTSAADGKIEFRVLDAGDEQGLLALGQERFDSALCNMALFDMAEIEPLFRNLYSLLKPGGCFVFSMVHPCFNQADATRYSEFEDRDGELITTYGVRVSRYMTPSMQRGLALRGQPTPQPYFHRPLDMLLNVGLKAGFVMNGIEERAFPATHPPGRHELGWGPNFSEIPPVIVFRLQRQ